MNRRALSVYRWMLRLLPERFRDRHGADLEAAFLESWEAEAGSGSFWQRGRWWITITADLVGRIPYEHWRERRRADRRKHTMWSTLLQDLRFTVRSFLRQPGVTATVILTLGLGIAASVAVFTLLNGLFLRPFPFPDPGRLVYLDETAPRWNLQYTGINYPDFYRWRQSVKRFEGMALYDLRSANLSEGTTPERISGAGVTYDFAKVLGIRPALGRSFTPEEDRPNGPSAVMLGYRLWQERFAGDPGVVGRTLRIDGVSHTVVGVLPRGVSFPVDAQLWLPLAQDPMATNQAYAYAGVGRLRAGVTLEEARQNLTQAHRAIWAERDTAHVVSPLIMPLRERLVADFRNIGAALGVGVVLVLLIACANVASIMLARAIYRQREVGVRVALGASLGRVARQMITESLTLSLVAGGVGLLVGQAGLSLLLRTVPDRFPDWARFTPDGRTILFSALVVVLSALFFGVAPLLQIRRQDGRGALVGSSGRASISLAQRRTLNGLVVAEVALATVLLVGCGLLLRAYARVRDTDPGFRVDRVLSFRVALPPLRYPGGSERRRFFEEAIDRLKTVPGVRNVGAISCPPFTCHNGYFFEAEGEETGSRGLPSVDPVVLLVSASPGYFDVMGIRLLQGRVFTESDGRQGGLRAVVVNETFVKQKWPGVANPVGRRIRARGADSTAWLTVVGVTGDVKHYGLDTPMLPSVYLPLALVSDITWASYAFQLQTVGSPTAVLPDARRIIQSLDAELPLFQVSSMADALEHSLALRRAFAWLLAVFAGIALVLAIGGIYAVLSYLVGRRIREIGIRMTLGAQRRQVLSLVVRQGVVLVILGLGLGLPMALFGGRLLGSQLVGVSWSDPVILLAVAGGLMVVGAVAALIPARRASAVDPRQALGAE